jgi:2,4-dienoyl-CoA reductase-like NADH-dependent reductase (Old Yellow Enzyme family)
MSEQMNPHFQPFVFKKGITVKNRIAMAPMTTWASNDDYTISEEEVRHYRARVKGVGLVITGCSRVTPSGIGFTHEFASYEDAFLPSLKKLAAAAKSDGAPAILQLYHAGNKAIPELIPNGDLVSASAIEVGPLPFVKGEIIPRPLTQEEILAIIKAFGDATRRAIEAGFDGVELHGAHGFLLQNFFSPLYNQRTDQWGGSAENRMRFPLEVVKEVLRVISEHATRPFLLGYRISPEEPQAESYKIKDIYPFIDQLIGLGIDYLHASLFHVLEAKPIGVTDGKTIAELILDHVAGRVPVIAAGQIKKPEDAAKAIDLGLALVAIGQALVINPNWVELAAKGEKVEEAISLSKLPALALPKKLWTVIDTAKGWFQLAD